jgi:hypothetical protein
MAADFVGLGQSYDAVLVLLGIDERKYVRVAQQAARRFDEDAPMRGDFTLAVCARGPTLDSTVTRSSPRAFRDRESVWTPRAVKCGGSRLRTNAVHPRPPRCSSCCTR